MEKIKALANFLGCEVDELNRTTYDENLFEYGRQEYLVLTEDEREKEVHDRIRQDLWAFNTEFILDHASKIDVNGQEYETVKKAFQEMQTKLCESANEIVFAIIDDFDDFVSDAVNADGYGHFLSQYDGEENEESEVIDNKRVYYYIYRQN
jgi:hypothetical protein